MEFWKEDSIYLHDDIVHKLGFDALVMRVAPEYDPFGETRIINARWEELLSIAAEMRGEIFELVNEADSWAQNTFAEYEMFTILGL